MDHSLHQVLKITACCELRAQYVSRRQRVLFPSTAPTQCVCLALVPGRYNVTTLLTFSKIAGCVALKDFIPMAILDGPDPSAQPVGAVNHNKPCMFLPMHISLVAPVPHAGAWQA
eukprot:5108560-Amphidinium_carterae.3